MDSDDYGFFCDLETAKTMEYDNVEYYVVKVCTKSYCKVDSKRSTTSSILLRRAIHSYLVPDQFRYEVRTKPIGLDEKPCELAEDDTSSCCCITIKQQEHDSMPNQPALENCFYSTFAFLSRFPRDVYCSFMVCTVTASCIYLVITI